MHKYNRKTEQYEELVYTRRHTAHELAGILNSMPTGSTVASDDEILSVFDKSGEEIHHVVLIDREWIPDPNYKPGKYTIGLSYEYIDEPEDDIEDIAKELGKELKDALG